MELNKLPQQSADGATLNLEALYRIAPSCFTEEEDPQTGELRHVVNFDTLRELLGDQVADPGDELYQFTWPGKREARREAARPTDQTLRPVKEDSVDWDTTQNLYIEGDNLEVLKLLQKGYMGKVKMIYIDPPYNTGNDFVYDDDFAVAQQAQDVAEGNVDGLGLRYRRNMNANGRFHSDWCSMIYARLLACRSLLTEDGVIFISIDENEVNHLKDICDEIFAERNFIAELIWAAGRKNDSKYISVSHEYILAYFKNADYIKENNIIWREKKQGLDAIYATYDKLKQTFGDDYKAIEKGLKEWYKGLPEGHPAKDHSHYNRVDERGIFFASDISWPGGGGPKYEVLHPVTHNPVAVPSRGWVTSKEKMEQWIQEGKVLFAETEKGVPTLKAYLREKEYAVPYSIFYKDGRAASKRLAALMGAKVFENPKDEQIMQRLIEFCGTKDGDIVLDFFSGSGTTAHAVFLANVNQQLQRKFILVQLAEEISLKDCTSEKAKKVAKNAIALLDQLDKPHTIPEIAKERIRRAGRKIKEESPMSTQNLDTGFRVFRLSDSNMEDIYSAPKDVDQNLLDQLLDNVKPDRTDLDLLFGSMLDWGVELSLPMTTEEVDGKQVYTVNDGDLVACFASDVTEAVVNRMAEKQPTRLLFRDSCFKRDDVKINLFETLKQKLDWSEEEALRNIRVI